MRHWIIFGFIQFWAKLKMARKQFHANNTIWRWYGNIADWLNFQIVNRTLFQNQSNIEWDIWHIGIQGWGKRLYSISRYININAILENSKYKIFIFKRKFWLGWPNISAPNVCPHLLPRMCVKYINSIWICDVNILALVI